MVRYEAKIKTSILQNNKIIIETPEQIEESYLDYDSEKIAKSLSNFTQKPVQVQIITTFEILPDKEKSS